MDHAGRPVDHAGLPGDHIVLPGDHAGLCGGFDGGKKATLLSIRGRLAEPISGTDKSGYCVVSILELIGEKIKYIGSW